MTMIEAIRIYSLTVSVLVVIIGTVQARRWWLYEPHIRLLWLAAAVLNFTVLIGSAEALRQGNPGGYRVFATALGVTWLFATVLYRPVCALWARRRKEKP